MGLQSSILAGSSRLDQAASTGPSVKPGVPDDSDAIRRIQKALVALGYPLPLSFRLGPGAEPDGIYGNETMNGVTKFQRKAFPASQVEWDGRAGPKTLVAMDGLLPKGAPAPAPAPPTTTDFICGPDVTELIATTWTQVQTDFRLLGRLDKIRACNTIMVPIKRPDSLSIPTDLEKLKGQLQQFADIDGWDTIPLFQGESQWLRTPPIFDPATNGPCATPSSSDYGNPDPFADGHEDPKTCSDTVQVAGKCWLNGTVNYGMFGVMVRLCNDFAKTDAIVRKIPAAQILYSLDWATMLIRAYKRFGQNPEAAQLPIAWLTATFNGGPRAVPGVDGNRPKCKCTCGCKGDPPTTQWTYIWEPFKSRGVKPAPR
jgi:putative peptidoglycan binding protein